MRRRGSGELINATLPRITRIGLRSGQNDRLRTAVYKIGDSICVKHGRNENRRIVERGGRERVGVLLSYMVGHKRLTIRQGRTSGRQASAGVSRTGLCAARGHRRRD